MRHCNEINKGAHMYEVIIQRLSSPDHLLSPRSRGFVSAQLTVCFTHRLYRSHNSPFHIYSNDG